MRRDNRVQQSTPNLVTNQGERQRDTSRNVRASHGQNIVGYGSPKIHASDLCDQNYYNAVWKNAPKDHWDSRPVSRVNDIKNRGYPHQAYAEDKEKFFGVTEDSNGGNNEAMKNIQSEVTNNSNCVVEKSPKE